MSDRINKMRQKQAEVNGAVPIVPAPAKVAASDDSEVTFDCGHKRALRALRKRKCPACVDAIVRTEASNRKKRKPRRPVDTATKSERLLSPRGRLPDCSTFSLVYNSEREVWSGTLVAKETDSVTIVVRREGSSVIRLMVEMDTEYRELVKESGEKSSVVAN